MPDTSQGGDATQLSRLVDSEGSILAARSVNIVHGEPTGPSWRLVLTPDQEGLTVGATLSSPGGGVASSILLDLQTGERVSSEAWLDPSYLDGSAKPFEHFLAPPGRRSVRIAVGKLVAGSGDQLAVLDGSDLYVYDISGSEPRLLNSFTVSIPPASIRHREDTGSLELIDLDGNGLDEICIAPPGGSRGEVWRFDGNDWAPVGFLPLPARASSPEAAAVLVGQYRSDFPGIDSGSLQWFYPLTDKPPTQLTIGFSPIGVAVLADGGWLRREQRITLFNLEIEIWEWRRHFAFKLNCQRKPQDGIWRYLWRRHLCPRRTHCVE